MKGCSLNYDITIAGQSKTYDLFLDSMPGGRIVCLAFRKNLEKKLGSTIIVVKGTGPFAIACRTKKIGSVLESLDQGRL